MIKTHEYKGPSPSNQQIWHGGEHTQEMSMSASIKEDIIISHVARLLELPVDSINPESSFVSLGGHSIVAMKLSSACKAVGIKVTVANILLSKSITELVSTATIVEPKPAAQRFGQTSQEAIKPVEAPRPIPSSHSTSTSLVGAVNHGQMTEMQLSFLHSYKNQPGTNIINFTETYKTSDVPAIKAAWKAVIEAEPIFRMNFESADSVDWIETATAPFRWNEVVVDTQEAYEAELIKDVTPEYIEVSFDAVTLSTAGITTIVWHVHHAFIDGMSAQLVYNKLRAVLMGQEITPGAAFSDVVKGLRVHQEAAREEHQAFWKQQLEAHPSSNGELVLEPASKDAPAGIDSVSFTIPIDAVSATARQTGVSLASWYQAAWAMVLSMYTDSDSINFGTVLSGRNLPVTGVEDTIGPLINTLPFHVSLDRNATASDYLRSVFSHSVELSNVQSSTPEDGFTRNFTTALAMEFEMEPADDHAVRPIGASSFRVVPDIPLSVYMNFNGTLRLCFKPQQFNRRDIQRLADHYQNAIQLLLSTERTIDELMRNLLTAESKKTLMEMGNCNTDDTSLCSIHDDLVTLFERAARENPDNQAVEKAGDYLTYAELDKRAAVLANRLQEYVQPGEVVCVHADRSINWIVAMWGVLKAGAVYSAQDAALVPLIRNTNFETAGAKVFLTPYNNQRDITPEACKQWLSVEELTDMSRVDASFTPVHRSAPRPEDNAYLCFTSGSTGKPKGVMCHHAGLVAFQKDYEVRLFAAPGQKISQLMSPAFDGSIHEIFSALCYGATLILADGIDPFSHLRRANAAILTPSVAKILDPEDFPELKTVYLVGEPCPQYVNDVWSSALNLYNMYGPTEATCGATIQRLRPGRHVTIGPPNPTTRIYVLDRNQQLLPPGVVGEIYCAGVQVARGYIGRPQLTAERFLPDTICHRPGEMMYRTGDRGFLNHLGEVECLGRNDRQIKLRGYRTDLNDLEIRVAQAVTEATLVAICPKDDYLVCMIQPETLNIPDVRARISKVLPVHAMPRHIQAVAKFPMTGAGKLDYKAIAESCVPAETATKVAKTLNTDSEIAMAKAWKELLSLGADIEVSGESNFVALGGHSVMQLRLASKLASVFGVKVPVSKIVRSANLTELVQVVDGLKEQQKSGTAHKVLPLGRNKVSPIELEWMEKYELKRGTSAFNVTFASLIDASKVDIDHLVASWNAVLARHAIFRSRYHNDRAGRGGARRAYAKYSPQVMQVDSFNLWREVNRPFHLERQHPIRVIISKSMMLVNMSHIIADLTSLQVVLKEVMQLYSGAGLPPVKRAYHETTQWSTPATSSQTEWWSTYLDGSAENRQYSIPTLNDRDSYGGQTYLTRLPAELSQKVINYSETNKVTLHQMALASVAMALQLDRDDTDIVLGGPYFNRGHDDVETVGLFLEPIPIRVKYSATEAAQEDRSDIFVRKVQQSSQDAIANAIPWDQLLQAVGETTPDFPNHPLLDVMVTFHDDRSSPKLPLDGLEPIVTYTKGSKFALLAEFCAVTNDTVLLRLEHDTACISAADIQKVEGLIVEAMKLIVEGNGYGAIKEKLRTMNDSNAVEYKAVASYFGKKFADFRV